jgi:acyl-CoA thioesterase-1
MATATGAVLRGLVVLVLCLRPLATAATSVPDPAQPAQSRPDAGPSTAAFRIMAFGSSSTRGTGATSVFASYPSQLERLFNDTARGRFAVLVANRGVGGEDIDDMMKRLASELLSWRPDLVVWQVGSNDPFRAVPIDHFKAELKNGIAAIRASGAEVVLMEPQWSPRLVAADAPNRFVDAVREVGATQHAEVVRRFEIMRQWLADDLVSRTDLIGPDGLHMTDQGYAMLAKAVFAEISTRSTAFRARMAPATASKHP